MSGARSSRRWLLALGLLTSSCNCGPQGLSPGPAPVVSPPPAPQPVAPPDAPAPASGARFALAPEPSSILDGRLRARMPAGSHFQQLSPIAGATDWIFSLAPADQRLELVAYDALRLAGPDIEGEARRHLGLQPQASAASDSAPPQFEVRALPNAGPIRVVLAIPDRLVASRFCSAQAQLAGECETDERFMSAELLVAQADGVVVVIDFLCDRASCPRAELQTLAVDLAATLEPGPQTLLRAASPRTLWFFQIDVPADFVTWARSGADFESRGVERLVPLGAPAGDSLTIRSLGEQIPPRRERVAGLHASPGRLFERPILWYPSPSAQDPGLSLVHDCLRGTQAYSIRLFAASESGMADMRRIAESMRIVRHPRDPLPQECVPLR